MVCISSCGILQCAGCVFFGILALDCGKSFDFPPHAVRLLGKQIFNGVGRRSGKTVVAEMVGCAAHHLIYAVLFPGIVEPQSILMALIINIDNSRAVSVYGNIGIGMVIDILRKIRRIAVGGMRMGIIAKRCSRRKIV